MRSLFHHAGLTGLAATEGRATAMLLFAAFLWGTGNLANKTILSDIDPFSAVLLRNLLGALALIPLALAERHCAGKAGWLQSALPSCLMFALAINIQQWGYQGATVTNASFLVNVAGVLTPLLAYLLLRDRLRPLTMICALLVLLGALLMSGAAQSLARVNAGDLLCLLSAVFYALWIICLAAHLARFPTPTTTTLAQCLCAALIAAPFAALADPALPRNWWGAAPEALYLGLFSTAAAFALTAAAQSRVTASTAAVLISAESLFGAASGVLFLGERPEPMVVLGALLILTAIIAMALLPELKLAPTAG